MWIAYYGQLHVLQHHIIDAGNTGTAVRHGASRCGCRGGSGFGDNCNGNGNSNVNSQNTETTEFTEATRISQRRLVVINAVRFSVLVQCTRRHPCSGCWPLKRYQ